MQNSHIFEEYAAVYNQVTTIDYEKEAKDVYELLEYPKSILDIGCGTCAHWPVWRRAGCVVVGIERSRYMIAQAAHGCRRYILQSDAHNIGNLRLPPFRGITALYNVLGYMQTLTMLRDLPIRPGGLFVFDVLDYEKARSEGFCETVKETPGIRRVITPEVQYSHVKLRIKVTQAKDRPTKPIIEEHTIRLYTKNDLLFQARAHGYDVVDVRTEAETWRQWWVFRKQGVPEPTPGVNLAMNPAAFINGSNAF